MIVSNFLFRLFCDECHFNRSRYKWIILAISIVLKKVFLTCQRSYFNFYAYVQGVSTFLCERWYQSANRPTMKNTFYTDAFPVGSKTPVWIFKSLSPSSLISFPLLWNHHIPWRKNVEIAYALLTKCFVQALRVNKSNYFSRIPKIIYTPHQNIHGLFSKTNRKIRAATYDPNREMSVLLDIISRGC